MVLLFVAGPARQGISLRSRNRIYPLIPQESTEKLLFFGVSTGGTMMRQPRLSNSSGVKEWFDRTVQKSWLESATSCRS
jgi:hypothetical protein